MALAVECSELLEVYQWASEAESESEGAPAASEEIADIFIYLVLLSERLGIDLLSTAHEKVTKNETRFPAIST